MRGSGILILILVLCMLAACGGNSSRQARSLAPGSPSSPAQESDSYQLALNSLPPDMSAEVGALVLPKGCDPALFYALKKSFVQAMAQKLANGGKIVSVPPTGDRNKVVGLYISDVGGQHILNWPYRNIGDYDQSGTVGITDITPIAMHYGHNVGTDPLDIVVDGDGLGSVGISDVTPLAINFAVNVTSYRVEEAIAEAGPYTELGNVLLTNGTGADQGWMQLQYTLPNDDARWLRVVPLDAQGNPGISSDALQFGGGAPPVIVSVSPLSGATGAAAQFSAVVTGVGPFTYLWNFNGACTPDSSAAAQPNVTLSATAGNYNCSLTVSNASGSDALDFVVSIGNPPAVSGVAPLLGPTGAATQFTAAATGDAPLSYDWDFGGGATPDTSISESPTVTLGAPGAYDASITVTNPYGESFFGFTLVVTATGMPPIITSVTPTTGIEATEISISASVIGTPPIAYAWDFGGAATPSTSSDTAPFIMLAGPGTYPCSLVVDNAYGSDTYDFNLEILPVGAYDEIEDNDDLTQANPITFPLVSFNGHCGGPTGYDGDDDDYFTFSAAADDYLLITMAGTDNSYDLDIELLDGNGGFLEDSRNTATSNEAFEYQFLSTDIGPYYLHVYAYSGSGQYELNGTLGPLVLWNKNVIDDSTSNYLGLWSALTYTGGYPGCFYMDFDNYDVYFAYSLDADGMGAWKLYPVDVSPDYVGEYLSSGNINGYPCAVYSDSSGGIKFAICSTSDGSGTWDVKFVDNDGLYDPSVAQINGYPAVAYEKIGDTLNYAINSEPDGSGIWVGYPVDIGSGAYYTSMVALPNGNPGIFYNAHTSSQVRFATCDAYDGSGTWTNSLVLESSVYPSSSAAIVDGRPAVASIGSDNRPYYVINSQPDGLGSWSEYMLDSLETDSYISLALQDGKPAVIFHNYSEDVYYLKSVTSDGAGPWSVSQVLRGARVRSNCSLGWINNKPACVFMQGTDNWVGFAAPPD